MKRMLGKLWRNDDGAVAPTVALSLTALIAAGGIGFDYARLASLDTELQQAADQAALASATQLDQQPGATARAVAAAQSLLVNQTRFGNDGGGISIATGTSYTDAGGNAVARVTFYSTKADAEAGTNGYGAATTNDTSAKFVKVDVAGRQAMYALTPVVGAMSSGAINASAVAGVGSAICKVPPVMICNPDEPSTNTNEMLDFSPARGTGLRLVTGDATVPGNFGWLDAALGNGTPALAGELGYNVPQGPCQAVTGVTTKTGMDTSVLNAFNTRFDVYANGNTTCPNQGGGACNPAPDTRKDLVCQPSNSGTGCKNDTWSTATKMYDPWWDSDGDGTPQLAALPTDGSLDPNVMGYPHDICHSSWLSRQTCGIKGSAVWDVNAYFRVNYHLDETGWRALLGMSGTTAIPARYDVYQWELAHPNGTGSPYGINFPQPDGTSGNSAFSIPATGRTGVAAGGTQPDRRVIATAVLDCYALNAHGKTTNVPVPTWIKVFLTEPAFKRSSPPPGNNLYTDSKDIYVEFIEKTKQSEDQFASVVRRDVPYLVK
jgi:Flp pilus assembly protein TadG